MKKNREYIWLFALFLSVTEFFYYNYRVAADSFHLFDWMIEVVSDRFVVFLIQGIPAAVFANHFLVSLTGNDYKMLRYGNIKKVILVAECALLRMAACNVCILFMVVFAVALTGEGIAALTVTGAEIGILFSLAANLFLMDWVIGNILLLAVIFGMRERISVFLVVAVLMYNIAFTGNPRYVQKAEAKLTWAGNVLLSGKGSGNIHIGYWMCWVSLILILCLFRSCLPWQKLWQKLDRKHLFRVLVVVSSVVVFTALKYIAEPYLEISPKDMVENLAQYFQGFCKVNVFFFLYLFYQLPVWMFSYLYLTEKMNVFFVQYLLRGKSVLHCLFRMLVGVLAIMGIYYGTGVAVLTFPLYSAMGNVWNIRFLLIFVNLILQSMLIVLLAFEIWLWEREKQHTGIVIALAAHLILVVFSGKVKGIAAWIPLSAGVYRTHVTCQSVSCISQVVYLTFLTVILAITFLYRYEWIIARNEV